MTEFLQRKFSNFISSKSQSQPNETSTSNSKNLMRSIPLTNYQQQDITNTTSSNDILFDEKESVTLQAQLVPSDIEKKALLASFAQLRKEFLFCDASFLCRGILFRGHRILFASWSRWLRSLLTEGQNKLTNNNTSSSNVLNSTGFTNSYDFENNLGGISDDEVIHLDLFEPDAFGKVLDYMYGVPLLINMNNVEEILKIVRRLELQKLEQQCWRYLMTVLDTDVSFIEYLHDLADRYDCPTLKLASWKKLKEKNILKNSVFNFSHEVVWQDYYNKNFLNLKGTGLTGPGDEAFLSENNRYGQRAGFAGNLNENLLPSVFFFHKYASLANSNQINDEDLDEYYSGEDDAEESEEDDFDNEEIERLLITSNSSEVEVKRLLRKKRRIIKKKVEKRQKMTEMIPDKILEIEELDESNNATDVIFSWAKRLRDVYEKCIPTQTAEAMYDEDIVKLTNHTPNVKLEKLPKQNSLPYLPLNSSLRSNDYNSNSPKNSYNITPFQQTSSSGVIRPVSRPSTYPVPGEIPNQAALPPASGPLLKRNSNLNHSNTSNFLSTEMNIPYKTLHSSDIDWENELVHFYNAINKPHKLAGLGKILETWKGKEDLLLSSLLTKYQGSLTKKYVDHLEKLITIVENQTDSSFVG